MCPPTFIAHMDRHTGSHTHSERMGRAGSSGIYFWPVMCASAHVRAGTAKAAAATAPGENSHGSTLLEHAPTLLHCISSKWIGVTFRLFQGKQAERRSDNIGKG